MKKFIVGFIAGIVFCSAISYAAFTYKKTINETWQGVLNPGERIITVDAKCTRVVVYPSSSKMDDIKIDANEIMKITLMLQK